MYKHILYAVEFGKGTDNAIEPIMKLINLCHKPTVSLFHAVEISPYDVYRDIPQAEKAASYVTLAKEQLATVGKKLNVPPANQYVEVGNPKELIPQFLTQHADVDLLIIGHHERHSIYRLLGSTAYASLCHAKCQVLILPYPAY